MRENQITYDLQTIQNVGVRDALDDLLFVQQFQRAFRQLRAFRNLLQNLRPRLPLIGLQRLPLQKTRQTIHAFSSPFRPNLLPFIITHIPHTHPNPRSS